jgi:diaminopimelate decarboxylase
MSESFKKRLFPVLPKIVKKYPTPLHLYDKQGILETGVRMKLALGLAEFGESYNNYFAVKALPDPHILGIMRELGFGFDCSSVPELVLARGAGAGPDDIMFTSNNTSEAEFREALDHGGSIINLDDITLIRKLKRIAGKFPRLICFRYNPGKRRTGNSIIGDPFNAKYGITHAQIMPAYQMALDLGAKEFGLHTMVCSNELRATYMIETVRGLLEIAAMLYRQLGIRLKFINMGGGFGTPYRPGQKEVAIEFMGRRIHRLLIDFLKQHGFVPRLLSECGRYVTGPHGVLVTQVVNFKHTYKEYIGVDSGMQDLMRPGMYGAYHHIEFLDPHGVLRSGPMHRASVVGAICENCDRFATNRLLPKSILEGDLGIVENTGGHGSPMGFQYNGRLRCKALLFDTDNSAKLIRRAETIDDLFNTLIFPN